MGGDNKIDDEQRDCEGRRDARRGAQELSRLAVEGNPGALIAVFLRLSFLQGEVGRHFTEFGVVVAIAVAVSTFVALSLCPMLASKLLKTNPRRRFGRLVDTAFERPFDVLEHHDRIVHHEPDRQEQREQRQDIEKPAIAIPAQAPRSAMGMVTAGSANQISALVRPRSAEWWSQGGSNP